MSDPVDTTKVGKYNAIQSALCEIVSAESSCNMHPDPIPPVRTGDPEIDAPERVRYISESDANVKHAIEHMHAAFRLMNMAHHDQESLKTQVYRLVVQLREAGITPKIKTWLDGCSRCNEPIDGDEQIFCTKCTEEIELRAMDDAEHAEMEACSALDEPEPKETDE